MGRPMQDHLSLEGALREATMDIVEEDGKGISQQRRVRIWDKKKRNYVQVNASEVDRVRGGRGSRRSLGRTPRRTRRRSGRCTKSGNSERTGPSPRRGRRRIPSRSQAAARVKAGRGSSIDTTRAARTTGAAGGEAVAAVAAAAAAAAADGATTTAARSSRATRSRRSGRRRRKRVGAGAAAGAAVAEAATAAGAGAAVGGEVEAEAEAEAGVGERSRKISVVFEWNALLFRRVRSRRENVTRARRRRRLREGPWRSFGRLGRRRRR